MMMAINLKLLVLAAVVMGMTACTVITDITSSTSSTLDAATPDVTLNNFIDTRYSAIQQDAARGEGENIEALAQLLGAGDSKHLAGWMQAHYGELFSAGQTATDLVVRLDQYKAIPKG
jgi:hypothetical protein